MRFIAKCARLMHGKAIMKRVIAALAVIVAAAAGTWWIDNHHAVSHAVAAPVRSAASSCSAAPLTRDQAIQRAQARLGKFSASLGFHERFTEPSARFDDDSQSWIVTFRSPECMVMMVVDRCKPNELGGTTDCHAG
jgi:hypothetical protein